MTAGLADRMRPPPALEPGPARDQGPIRPADPAPLHDARALIGPGREARIVLDGQLYTLRITRAGKLILTK